MMAKKNLRMRALGLTSYTLLLLVFSSSVAAYNRPPISWTDLIDSSDLIVVGNVNAANLHDEDESKGIMVDVHIRQYLKGQGIEHAQLKILMKVRLNPVRVGSSGLFFIQKEDGNTYYELVDRDVGALEQTAAFCESKPLGSNWSPGYGARRHGEFLFDIPKEFVLDRKDCKTINYFGGHILSADKAALDNLVRKRISTE